ncbi:MAG: flagellar filament capping protein FliD [Lachnospiraceae bacterium]|nr:flagellar filament capping protein FliD [Lachnospiraceae bacterium]
MAMRLTGLMSGMDTESIIQELVSVKQTKVDTVKKKQTKLQWKQEAWKDLNSKIYKLYTSTLSDMRFTSSYSKRTTKVSNPNAVSVITGDKAMNSVQSLKIDTLAKTGYLTGKQLDEDGKYSASTVLTDATADGGMGLTAGSSIAVKVGDSVTQIEITEGMTISQFTSKLQSAGINASFDEKNQRFFISSKESGKASDFVLTGLNESGVDALISMGIATKNDLQGFGGGSTTAPQAVLDASVDSRLQNVLSEVSTVNNQINSVRSKLEGFGLTDLSGKTTAELKTAIDEFKGTEKYEELSDTQKEELDKQIESLDEYQAKLDELAEYYTTDADGKTVASDKLVEEVTDSVNAVYESMSNISSYVAGLDDSAFAGSYRTAGSDAKIYLNGAEFTSTSNTFEVNGLTLTVNATTAENEEITITTEDDTDGIYDMIKGFLKQYNELINEMDKLYNADSAKGYEPLTEDEKSEMSDDAVEKWENKIKESLLRGDSTINTVGSALKGIMAGAITMSDGSKMFLSDFGISTLSYFNAPENERNAYHIDGDSDDTNTSNNADKLKSMISSDPEKTIEFFTTFAQTLYGKLGDLMQRTDYSSSYTVYNDKQMQEEYNDYTVEIKELEQKLTDYEDKWYAKFAAMETAMSKMQNNANAVTSLLGG